MVCCYFWGYTREKIMKVTDPVWKLLSPSEDFSHGIIFMGGNVHNNTVI